MKKFNTKKPKFYAIMFHRFHKSKLDSVQQGSLSESNFIKIIKKIGKKNILSPQEWIIKYQNNSLKKNQTCFTFDDGLKSQKKIAIPIMKKFRIKAFFFIHSLAINNKIDNKELTSFLVSQKYEKHDNFVKDLIQLLNLKKDFFINNKKYRDFNLKFKKLYPFYSTYDIKYRFLRNVFFDQSYLNKKIFELFKIKKNKKLINRIWLNKKDIKNLEKEGHTIGLHSNEHEASISLKNRSSQYKDYKKNLNDLKKLSKKKIFSMSHPLGSYSKTTLNVLFSLGIKYGFCANLNEPLSKSNLKFKRLTIPRKDANFIIKKN